ncbi:MAG: radical SAM protein [Candidatus Margulisiibacteriota bacterium]
MGSKTCLYYITFQCNDMCEFCQVWNDKELQAIEDTSIEKHIENLKSAKSLGVKTLEVTGGEPLLYEKLPEFLTEAKRIGFKIDLYTNGILYPERAKSISGLADKIYFSLDYPIRDDHDRSRGLTCFSSVLASINLAKELKEKPAVLYTVTRDSIRFLPEMIEIAEKMKVEVYLNPVYDFHGLHGFEKESLDYIKYYFNRQRVRVNLAALEFIKNGGNNTVWPRCRVRSTTVTYLPDGNRAAPCLYNRGGEEGKSAECIGCTRWPYMLPSFSIGFDKYRVLYEWSKHKEAQS